MFCKTIILSNSQNIASNAPKGILTLSKDNSYIKGKIRLYNLQLLPTSAKIGLYINDNVQICTLTKKPNHYEFEINENIDITQSLYCAIIDTANNKQVLLEGGSFNGFYFSDSPFDAVLEAKDEDLEKTIDTALKSVDTCEKCDCENCEYKKYFYQQYSNLDKAQDNFATNQLNQSNDTSDTQTPIQEFQQDVIETLQNEIIEEIPSMDKLENYIDDTNKDFDNQTDLNEREKLEFLNDVIYQLDEMFTRYPEDEVLNSIIPNSKFIRVDGERPYVLGVIYENKMMKFIAYGTPAQYNSLPPSDLGQHYQWLPLNPRDTLSDGYFMIYQDATTGSIVEINFEEE